MSSVFFQKQKCEKKIEQLKSTRKRRKFEEEPRRPSPVVCIEEREGEDFSVDSEFEGEEEKKAKRKAKRYTSPDATGQETQMVFTVI